MAIPHEVIEVGDRLYVLAGSSRLDTATRVLKHGDTFAVFDRRGDISSVGLGELGVYHEGTRHLSQFEVLINGQRFVLLNSTVIHDNTLLSVDLNNPTLHDGEGRCILPQGVLHLRRRMMLWNAVYHEELILTNYGAAAADISLVIEYGADFADIFEVRGFAYQHRSAAEAPSIKKGGVTLRHPGEDGVQRRTRIGTVPPARITARQMHFDVSLKPHESHRIYLDVACESGDARAAFLPFDRALDSLDQELENRRKGDCRVFTSNEQFNDWLNQSAADLHMLISESPEGLYPYAGIPWFSTPFGRDGIITALQYLWINPSLARGVLNYLAVTQADKVDPQREAEPGKILHETRKGVLAALGEIPFDRYYGTVDATPLFIMLAGAYFHRTGDRPFIEGLWPHLEKALDWLGNYGDADGDCFIEYQRHGATGLANQGWKDSDDSIFHADGTLAQGPIALCEVQGYAYSALLYGAELASLFGERQYAKELRQQAKELKRRFKEAFWLEDLSTYAIALDGDKRPCRVRSSNAGHCLLTGIAATEHARRTAETLLGEDSFCGWGIRTLAEGTARYNPMSYHNGSVWPHDNAMTAMGLARYGLKQHALRILTSLFQTSIFMDLRRLPELFCGFPKRDREGPTLYPVACSPQAWSSAAVFFLLQACLGLSFHPDSPEIRFNHPILPDYLDWIELRDLRVGNSGVDLMVHRHNNGVAINVLDKHGGVEVAIIA